MGAITNYYKLDGFQKQIFLPSQFWEPEVQNKKKSRCPQGLAHSRDMRENPLLHLLAAAGII